ncbi:hypothetical protein C8F04DRAFT_1084616 [Mycena alexandri]|uniref:Uncharacterized protein n=1 Tax=Mycena alexandri TaxID=1745969 RepID=A0AAD6X7P2_9AGAR|nr:hypothetical protein C8F04DRAFT_1084616 [Mycena alexandri]
MAPVRERALPRELHDARAPLRGVLSIRPAICRLRRFRARRRMRSPLPDHSLTAPASACARACPPSAGRPPCGLVPACLCVMRASGVGEAICNLQFASRRDFCGTANANALSLSAVSVFLCVGMHGAIARKCIRRGFHRAHCKACVTYVHHLPAQQTRFFRERKRRTHLRVLCKRQRF